MSEFGINHVAIWGSNIHMLHSDEGVLVVKGYVCIDLVDMCVQAESPEGIRIARHLPSVFETQMFNTNSHR